MTQENHADREHSELSASSCYRWWNCPGSIRMSRLVEPTGTGTNTAAEEGTAAHEMASLCLKNGQDAIEWIGRTINGFEVDEEWAEAVQVYLDEVRSVWPDTLPDMRWIEQRFTLDKLNPPANMFGTADSVAFVTMPGVLHVHDLKFGKRNRVEADGNPQLKYYALGALLTMPDMPLHSIKATIVQPRQPAAGRDPVRTVEITAGELDFWSIELMQHADAAMAPDAPLNPGDWCLFCPAKTRCPARTAAALAEAQSDLGSLVAPEATPFMDLIALTPEELGRLAGRLDLLEQWAADARGLLSQALNAGLAVPGWKLVEAEGRAKWRDEAEAEEMLPLLGGIDPYTNKIVSPAQARTRVAEAIRDQHKTKKAAELAAKAILEDLTIRPKSTVVVPDSDKRPAIAGGGDGLDALPEIPENLEQ